MNHRREATKPGSRWNLPIRRTSMNRFRPSTSRQYSQPTAPTSHSSTATPQTHNTNDPARSSTARPAHHPPRRAVDSPRRRAGPQRRRDLSTLTAPSDTALHRHRRAAPAKLRRPPSRPRIPLRPQPLDRSGEKRGCAPPRRALTTLPPPAPAAARAAAPAGRRPPGPVARRQRKAGCGGARGRFAKAGGLESARALGVVSRLDDRMVGLLLAAWMARGWRR